MFKPFLKLKNFSLPLFIIKKGENIFISNKNILKEINNGLEIKLSFNPDRIFESDNNPRLIRDNSKYKPYIINSINDIKLLDEKLNIGFDYVYSYPFYLAHISKDIFTLPTYYLKNINDNTVIWKSNDLINPKLIGNKIFSDNIGKTIIKCFRTNDLKLIWQLNLSKEFDSLEISHFIGVCKDILIIGMGTTTDVDNYLIGIDTLTGKILWKTQTSIIKHVIIDEVNGLLRSIISKYYFEVNILTGVLKKIQYIESDNEFNSQRNNFVQVEDYLITTDWRKGKIGVFNTITHKFDWIHEEKEVSFPAGSPMIYKAPYLFVQDNKHTLHIFEKISNENV